MIHLSGWLDDIKSYRTYTEICRTHIVCQSGVHLITYDLADCELSLSDVAINVPNVCSYVLSSPVQTFTHNPLNNTLCVVYTSPTYSIYTHMYKIQQTQFYKIIPVYFLECKAKLPFESNVLASFKPQVFYIPIPIPGLFLILQSDAF